MTPAPNPRIDPERLQTEETLRRQNEYLKALQQTTLDLLYGHEIDDLLKMIVKRAALLLGTDSGYLDLLDPEDEVLRPRFGTGVAEYVDLRANRSGHGLTGIVWATRQPLAITDYDTWEYRLPEYTDRQIGSAIGVPLLLRDRVIGVLGLVYPKGSGRTFDTEAIDLLQQFAQFAALALENARLLKTAEQELVERRRAEQELRLRDRVFEAVNIACTNLLRSDDWTADITAIAELLGRAIESDRVMVYEFFTDPDGRQMCRGRFIWNREPPTPEALAALVRDYDLDERGLTGIIDTLRAGQSVYHHRSQRPADKLTDLDGVTFLNVPIFVRDALWGSLHFVVTSTPREWSKPERDALQIAADMLGAVIEGQQVDEALRRSQERLNQAVSLAGIGIWEWEVATDRLIWNDELHHIMGTDPATFGGKSSDAILLIHPDDRGLAFEYSRQAFARAITEADLAQHYFQPHQTHEVRFVRPNGEQRRILTQTIGVVDKDGLPLRLVGVTLDITERIRAEAAIREHDRLRLALEKEQELHAIKHNVMRTISHEFRTPLAIILSASSLLSHFHERMSIEQRQQKLDVIEAQVGYMNAMVGEITSVVYDLVDQFVFQPTVVDLDRLCRAQIDELRSSIGSKHDLRFTSDDTLHAAFVDLRLVTRILINLLSNAIKYSREGSDILLRLYEEDRQAVISVSDRGIGISDEAQARLFEPFYRAPNAITIGGTGLGLSIVQDCVRLHRGRIAVESRLGRGTTFTVWLPLEPDLASSPSSDFPD